LVDVDVFADPHSVKLPYTHEDDRLNVVYAYAIAAVIDGA